MSNEIQRLDAGEFLRGQRDCSNGAPHRSGQHEDYDRGYSAQYELEQVIESRTSSEGSRRVK